MKNISIVIPVFNEEKRISKTFEALRTLKLPRGLTLDEILFVNDGSKDKTLHILKYFVKANPTLPIQILSYPINKGKGFAVKTGMLASNADYTLLCDADMSTPFSELKKFTSHTENNLHVIIGTRKNGKSTVVVHQPLHREVLGKGFTRVTRFVLQLQITDFTCGFKLFSKEAIAQIFPHTVINRWGYDAEILYIANKKRIDIHEMPVLWSDNKGTHVNIVTAAPQTIIEMVKILYTHTVVPQTVLLATKLSNIVMSSR